MSSPDIISMGEALIDIMPAVAGQSIVQSGQMRLAAGGAPANVAVGLARLGTASGFIGKLGDDFFGHYLQQILAENQVDTSRLRFTRQANTGLAFVSWDERGDASYLFYRNPSADTLFALEDLDAAYLQSAKVLQFGSLLLASEPAASACYKAFEIAHSAGVLLSYDINLRLNFWPDEATALEKVRHPLEYAGIVKLNRAELAFLTGIDDPEEGVSKLWRSNFKLVVVTLDKTGSYYHTEKSAGFVPAFRVEAVDTVGAGDGFLVGLLDGLRQANFDFGNEAAIRKACLQGAACGAIVVSRAGAIPAMPYRAEVEALLASKQGQI